MFHSLSVSDRGEDADGKRKRCRKMREVLRGKKTTGKRKLRKLWEEIFDHTLYSVGNSLSSLSFHLIEMRIARK